MDTLSVLPADSVGFQPIGIGYSISWISLTFNPEGTELTIALEVGGVLILRSYVLPCVFPDVTNFKKVRNVKLEMQGKWLHLDIVIVDSFDVMAAKIQQHVVWPPVEEIFL